MKNVYKKFLTLAMALVMTISCTAVAFATEEPINVASDSVAVTTVANVDDFVAMATEATAADEGVMPLDLQALSDVFDVTDITTGKTVSGNLFRFTDTSNITLTIYTPVGCTVTIKGTFGSKQRYIPAGGGTYSIATGRGSFSYTIRFHDASGTKARGQFFATEGWFDG